MIFAPKNSAFAFRRAENGGRTRFTTVFSPTLLIINLKKTGDTMEKGGEVDMKYIWAFVIGGVICVIAQVLIDRTKLTPARILVSYVVVGVILGGVGLYEPLVELAGGGATVPLTGFGYNISRGIREAVDEKGLLGIFTGAFSAAAGGTAAALIFGYIVALIFKAKPKR